MEEFPQIQVRTCSESDLHSQRTSFPHRSCVCLRRSQDSKYLGSCQGFKMAGMQREMEELGQRKLCLWDLISFFTHTCMCGTCACLYDCVHVDMRVCEYDEGVPTCGGQRCLVSYLFVDYTFYSVCLCVYVCVCTQAHVYTCTHARETLYTCRVQRIFVGDSSLLSPCGYVPWWNSGGQGCQ